MNQGKSTSMDQHQVYDLIIVGGGINGVGIAADAAGRGLKVALIEQNDFASATSSWSSKLIHGGLRYLEHYEFRLVKEALSERDVLLKRAPHIIEPLRFILPHHPGLRPAWLLRMGLFLYDHLNIGIKKKKSLLGRSSLFHLKYWPENPLQDTYSRGFYYSDCFVDDSRLVVTNAISAQDHGAHLWNYVKATNARIENGQWLVDCEPQLSGIQSPQQLKGKILINAAGPWVQSFIEQKLNRKSAHKIRLIKGSHILIPKLYQGDDAFILQNSDQRVVFTIPYRGMTLVGTTDVLHTEAPEDAKISDDEKQYLIDIINQYFKHQSKVSDILFDYSGVRPLCDDESDDPSAVTRDYTLNLETNQAPLLNIFGGKLTTFRKLSEAALEKIQVFIPQAKPKWTAHKPLPGGDMSRAEVKAHLENQYPWLGSETIQRYITSYGSLCFDWLDGCHQLEDLGEMIFSNFSVKELNYLIEKEFAKTPEDVLWRRSKLGYTLKSSETDQVVEKIQAIIDQSL